MAIQNKTLKKLIIPVKMMMMIRQNYNNFNNKNYY